MHANIIAAKVAAVNNAHSYAKELYNTLSPIFRHYIGEKVIKNDGTLLAKIQKLIPDLPLTTNLSVWQRVSYYNIVWVIVSAETYQNQNQNNNEIALRYETIAVIGSLQDGILMDICDSPQLRDDYTVAEIEDKLEARRIAETAHRQAESALEMFNDL